MNLLDNLEWEEGYVALRLAGQTSLQQLTKSIASAIAVAATYEYERLLVDATQCAGFEVPKLWQRYDVAEQLAYPLTRVKLALVVRFEWMDGQRFGVTVARNRGLKVHIFSSEAEAKVWLFGKAVH